MRARKRSDRKSSKKVKKWKMREEMGVFDKITRLTRWSGFGREEIGEFLDTITGLTG
jgi:hypothetical protein